MQERVTQSTGNVFADLGFERADVTVLTMRAELMASIRSAIAEHGWTVQEATEKLGIGQKRVFELTRGKPDEFDLDVLVKLAVRVGQKPRLVLDAD
jgi:predicted XRE-type DNA-binding protein